MMQKRRRGAKGKAPQHTQLPLGQQHGKLGQQRPMHHQPAIPLDLPRIVDIVMYPVPVERQRRVAKQHRAVEPCRLADGLVASGGRRCGGRTLAGIFAIDEILPFGQNPPTTLPDLVTQGYKAQRSAAPLFARNALPKCAPLGRDPGEERRIELQPPARPHPPRKTHVRYDPSRARVPISPQLAGRLRIPEMDLMKEWRQRIARFQARLDAKHGLQRPGTGRIHDIRNPPRSLDH